MRWGLFSLQISKDSFAIEENTCRSKTGWRSWKVQETWCFWKFLSRASLPTSLKILEVWPTKLGLLGEWMGFQNLTKCFMFADFHFLMKTDLLYLWRKTDTFYERKNKQPTNPTIISTNTYFSARKGWRQNFQCFIQNPAQFSLQKSNPFTIPWSLVLN